MILKTDDKETQTFGELKEGYMFKDGDKIYVKLPPHPGGGFGMCMSENTSKKFKDDDVVVKIVATYHNHIKPEIVKKDLKEGERIHIV